MGERKVMYRSVRIETTMDLKGKKVLFFTASFLGFQDDIKNALEAMGASVDWYDERVGESTFTKALVRINRNALALKIKRYYERIIEDTKAVDYDYIFFVNIEAATQGIIESLKQYHPNAKFILYEWDSILNNKNAKGLLNLFDETWSFDKNDCQEFGMNFLPLFYNNEYAGLQEKDNYEYEVMFIGTTHSDRYRFVKSIEDQIEGNKFNWFYFPSRLLYLKMLLQDKWFRTNSKYLDFRFSPLSKKDLLGIVEKSRIVLDAQHPKQTGLTMRTLETLGARRKLITTNQYVKEYDFYNPNNILIVDRNNPIIIEEFLKNEFEVPSSEIYKKYSLDNWLRTIFHN